jgi:hypothetical protein
MILDCLSLRYHLLKLNILLCMYNVQDYSILYNSVVRPDVCKGWHFAQMWKALGWPHHFTKRGGLFSFYYI